MVGRHLLIFGAMLGATVLFAASDGYAFTSGAEGGAAAESPAPEPPSPAGASGYNFSDPNFSFSVRKDEAAPKNADEPEASGSQPPFSAPAPAKPPGFFGRMWDGFLDLFDGND
jgi:hypothetical protein